MNRRRFLAITAAAAGMAGRAGAGTFWQGRAFGADCRISLTGPRDRAEAVLDALPQLIAGIEGQFSLHDPQSVLSRLNATGQGRDLPGSFLAVLRVADAVHRATGGAFDPTVQAVWEALAAGRSAPAEAVGWHRVTIGETVVLCPGQKLTLNGIAQGYAADAVRALIAAEGFTEALVDLGETATLGGNWEIGIADPVAGVIGKRRLVGTAMSVSSPRATLVRGHPHIIHPAGTAAIWSSVAVEAETATMADALSTALVFLNEDEIRNVQAGFPGMRSVTLIDAGGNLSTL
jgi:FAD:protein FMN transferase